MRQDDELAKDSQHPRNWRRFFRYSLRSLLLGVALFAIAGFVYRYVTREERAIQTLAAQGARISWVESERDFQWEMSRLAEEDRHYSIVISGDSWTGGERGLRHLADISKNVRLELYGPEFTDSALQYFEAMPRLEFLTLGGTSIIDNGLAHLNPHLEELDVSHSRLGDQALKHVQKLTKLEVLSLSDTCVTDQGLKRLRGHPSLRQLYLSHTGVSDHGLSHLESLSKLQYVQAVFTEITAAGAGVLGATCSAHSVWAGSIRPLMHRRTQRRICSFRRRLRQRRISEPSYLAPCLRDCPAKRRRRNTDGTIPCCAIRSDSEAIRQPRRTETSDWQRR